MGSGTARYDASARSVMQDLRENAKTFMYPTNVLSTKVVTNHQQVVLAAIAKKTDPRRQEIHPEILRYADNMWAQSTVEGRRGIWNRYIKFRQAQGQVGTMDRAAAEFIATIPNVTLGTRKTYAVQMRGLFREPMIPCPTLSMVRKGMVAMGANIPEEKATPIRRDQALEIVREYHLRMPLLSLTFWLMWKTAPRFTDVNKLTRENFLVASGEEMVLVFGKYKTNRSGTVKMTSLCHIRARTPMVWQAKLLNSLTRTEKIVPLGHTTFNLRVQQFCPDLTTHSFKHGAHAHLVQMLAEGKLQDAMLIPMLLKHSGGGSNFPDQTLAYSDTPSLILYARQFKIWEATLLL